MNQDRTKRLLQAALPPVEGEQEPSRDLWPAVELRVNAKAASSVQPQEDSPGWVWFDCALLAGLVGLAAFFPASIPVLLYYL